MDIFYKTIQVNNWWRTEGYADVEWWIRNANEIEIIQERISFRKYIDLPYLFQEIKLIEKQL